MRSHWANFIGQQPAKQLPQGEAQAKSKRQRAKGKVEAARRKGFISMLRIEERRKKIPVSFASLVDLLRRAIKYIHSRLIGLVLWGP